MQLLTEKLIARFKEVGSQADVKDPIVIAKFFNPTGAGTWWATEYYAGMKKFFGYVSILGGDCDEWGYFTLSELEEFRGPMGQGIERDLYCGEHKISSFVPSLKKEKAELSTEKIKGIIKTYDKMEDENDHGGAALYLAQLFGTETDIFILKRIIEIHEKIGSIPYTLSKFRLEISSPLYRKYLEETKQT